MKVSENTQSIARDRMAHRLFGMFAVLLITISLVYFILCATRPYMGVEIVLHEDGWVVENVDMHGLAFSSGIQAGDMPLLVNGQPADAFLGKYQAIGSVRSLERLQVQTSNGQIISADINTGAQSGKSLVEIFTWFVPAAVFWATGAFIFIRKPQNSAALLLFICGSVLGLVLGTNLAAERLFPLARDLTVIAATIGPWLLLHFFLVLPDEREWLRRDRRIAFIYVFPAIILLLYPFIGTFEGQASPDFRVVRLIGYAIGFLAVIGVAILNYTRAKLPHTREQMKIVLVGCVIAITPFVMLSVLPAAVNQSIILPSDFSLLFLSFIPLSLGYAVATQRLMDIDVVIRRGVIYGLITLVLTVILTIAFAVILSGGIATALAQQFLLALVLSIVAVFLMGPTRSIVENIVDKVLYKDRFDYRQTIHELSTSLSATNDVQVASSLIVDAPTKALNLAGACLFLATDRGSFEIGASRGIFNSDASQRQLLGLILRRNTGVEFPNLAETPDPDVAFIIPLIAASKEVGVLFLSPKENKQDFTGRDFYFIQGLASVAAVSLRALLVAESDIKQRLRHENAILAAKLEWESTFDSIPDLICILDDEHNIVRVNKAMAEEMGMSPAETIGRKCYELMHGTSAPPRGCPGLISSSGCDLGSEITRCGNTYQINISTLKAGNRKSGRYVHIARDVTAMKNAEAEQKRLKEKAELSSRLAAVGEMAAGIAHEINNPLTGVLGFSELLLSEDLPPEVKEEVKVIADGSKRVAEIVRRMLTFARQTKPVKAKVLITELIDNTLELRGYVLRTAGVEVVKDYQQDLPWMVVDPGQMQQVFLNVIVNAEHAIKRTGKPGKLTISARAADDRLRLIFNDNGPGIDPEVLPKLFQPFFTTKDPGEGTGLGLSLSRSIILEHGGTIEIESEPGQGTDVIIELPVRQEADETHSIEPGGITQPGSTNRARILVIDDEECVRGLASEALQRDKRKVDIACDAAEGLEMLGARRYDAVIMDLRMPGKSGMTLYAEIMSRWPSLQGRIVVMTGDAMGQDVKDFAEKHQLEILAKPFEPDDLESAISQILYGKKN